MTCVSRRSFLASVGFQAALLLARRSHAWEKPADDKPADAFDFYAMDTGLRGPDIKSLEDEVRVLADLGYWGIDYTLDYDRLPQLLELLDRHSLKLACVYLSPAIEDKPDPKLFESIRQMKGRATRVELAMRSGSHKPSDPAGDEKALEFIKPVSDACGDTGPVVSIYPHAGAWTERVGDGVRLAEKSGRKNVGTNFNLVHWKWIKQDEPQEKILKDSLPHLFAVSINGLDGNTIVPLDAGDYDVGAFVERLKSVGYRGPVGLQGYGIPGESRKNLERSMTRWREILAKLH